MRRNAAPSKLQDFYNKIPKLNTDYTNIQVIEPQQTISKLTKNFQENCNFSYFTVAYGKPSKKKHKTWEGDGFISISDSNIKLMSSDGKEMGSIIKKQLSKVTLEEGATFYIGGKFVEILSAVSQPIFEVINDVNLSTSDGTKVTFSNKKFKPVMPGRNNYSAETQLINEDAFTDWNMSPVIMPRPSASHIFKYNQSCSPVRDVILDPRLSQRMRPHQIDGVIFLYECILGLRSHGGTGAILADAMGLGKTVQTIALVWTLLNQGPYDSGPFIQRCIIVCPSSLVLNWKNEFEKWIGSNRIKPFCVTGDIRVQQFVESPSNSVLILSYEMLIRNLDDVQNFSFDLIICDEAHRLKNSSIKTFTGVESLRIPRRILLTGTPLQNDMDEFFALVEFCNPGILGCDKDVFRKRFVNPMTAARDPGASQNVVDHGFEMSLILQRITQSFMLRRTETVNTRYLPPKDEYIIFCSPTPEQIQLYDIILQSQTLQIHLDKAAPGVEALSSILLLRKLCNDPILFIEHVYNKENVSISPHDDRDPTLLDEIHKNLERIREENEILCELSSRNTYANRGKIYSGKLRVTAQMLKTLKPKEKLVLASHFTQTLNVLQTLCNDLGLKFQRIDGQTASGSRMRIVNDFNKIGNAVQEQILLLSCKAGGEGLNLIGASKIILYDLDWNPATDAQTMARVWRDGQKDRVSVYRLVTTGTVEESLLQRQVSKQQLSTSIVDLTKFSSNQTSFSKQELKDIFTLHTDVAETFGCWTHQLLNCDCHITGTNVTGRPISVDSPTPIVNTNCQLGLKQISHKVHHTSSVSQLSSWNHWIGEEEVKDKCTDNLILSAVNQISCVFMRTITTCDDDQRV